MTKGDNNSSGFGRNGSSGGPGSGKLSFSTIALAAGILLIVFGVWQLAERFLGVWYADIWHIINLIISIAWPLVIIAGGVALMVVARKGNLSLPTDKKLFRSTRNRKLSGVCGGIAEYLRADPAVVRVITIVLAILCWYVIVPLYILFWIIIPNDTKSYNNWV
ncbi:MAG: PspC domain-containing protein [Coriobacteriales bacterium]|jgi:phage shock protein PspC (stress-responsive transcriptional regulator)|nr:PspC domain-containing protein [Coriobacteriales bacterium]